jgi:hypothetical protein
VDVAASLHRGMSLLTAAVDAHMPAVERVRAAWRSVRGGDGSAAVTHAMKVLASEVHEQLACTAVGVDTAPSAPQFVRVSPSGTSVGPVVSVDTDSVGSVLCSDVGTSVSAHGGAQRDAVAELRRLQQAVASELRQLMAPFASLGVFDILGVE